MTLQRQVIKEQVGVRHYRDRSLRRRKGLTVQRQVIKERAGFRHLALGCPKVIGVEPKVLTAVSIN